MAAALPRHGALPAADLMKARGRVVQMANIHQSNNMSDDAEGREESSTGLTEEGWNLGENSFSPGAKDG